MNDKTEHKTIHDSIENNIKKIQELEQSLKDLKSTFFLFRSGKERAEIKHITEEIDELKARVKARTQEFKQATPERPQSTPEPEHYGAVPRRAPEVAQPTSPPVELESNTRSNPYHLRSTQVTEKAKKPLQYTELPKESPPPKPPMSTKTKSKPVAEAPLNYTKLGPESPLGPPPAVPPRRSPQETRQLPPIIDSETIKTTDRPLPSIPVSATAESPPLKPNKDLKPDSITQLEIQKRVLFEELMKLRGINPGEKYKEHTARVIEVTTQIRKITREIQSAVEKQFPEAPQDKAKPASSSGSNPDDLTGTNQGSYRSSPPEDHTTGFKHSYSGIRDEANASQPDEDNDPKPSF